MGLWFQPAAAKFLMCLVDAEGNEPATCGLSQSRAPAVSPDNFKCKYTYELGHTRRRLTEYVWESYNSDAESVSIVFSVKV